MAASGATRRVHEAKDSGGIGGHAGSGLLGEAEVQHLDSALAGTQDVVRLEVAVDDSGFMGGGERVGNLHGGVQQHARFAERSRGRAVHELATIRPITVAKPTDLWVLIANFLEHLSPGRDRTTRQAYQDLDFER